MFPFLKECKEGKTSAVLRPRTQAWSGGKQKTSVFKLSCVTRRQKYCHQHGRCVNHWNKSRTFSNHLLNFKIIITLIKFMQVPNVQIKNTWLTYEQPIVHYRTQSIRYYAKLTIQSTLSRWYFYFTCHIYTIHIDIWFSPNENKVILVTSQPQIFILSKDTRVAISVVGCTMILQVSKNTFPHFLSHLISIWFYYQSWTPSARP